MKASFVSVLVAPAGLVNEIEFPVRRLAEEQDDVPVIACHCDNWLGILKRFQLILVRERGVLEILVIRGAENE